MAYKPESQDAAQKDWTQSAGQIALLKGLLQLFQENALGVDLQYSSVAAEKVTIMGGMDIRETNRYWDVLLDFSMLKNTVLKVSNTTDQQLRVIFLIKDVGPLKNYDGTNVQFTIAADTTDLLVTPDNMPALKYPFKETITLQIQPVSGTAPARGQIIMDAYTAPII